MKKSIAWLLCISIVLSLAVWGIQSLQTPGQVTNPSLSTDGNPQKEEPSQENGSEDPTTGEDQKPVGDIQDIVVEELDRDDKELIADLVGGREDVTDLTDAELNDLVEDLLDSADKDTVSSIVNLGNQQKPDASDDPVQTETQPEGFAPDPDHYDDNGAMNIPFDQAYPELIEDELVRFSGESILIKLKSDKLTDGLKAAGIGALNVIVPMDDCAWYEAKLVEGTDAKEALAAVRKLDETILAEFNYEIEVAALDHRKEFDDRHKEEFDKNDRHKDQWHMHHCGIPDGYGEMATNGGDSSVIVAVIDSGVDYEHEDLRGNMWVNADEIPDNGVDDDNNGYVDDYYGVDIVAGYGNGGDTNGHGTHVAGIIAAQNNNLGVVGIAYNVKIMSVKAAMHNGTLNQADIAKAVLYAYENGAEVINMSFGGTACSIAVQDALATAYTRCVLVASAGNDGAPNEGFFAIPNYPAALTYVLGVMSVDETGRESIFTNWDVSAFNGVEYELYAPGENIMSTLPGNKYGYLSGTSMAAPVVSAFAAILRSEYADRDMYPTKFIYGQLSATSDNYAECLNPESHGLHNLPQIVDLNAALTKLPKPDVNLQEYYLFDDPALSEKNNGDGVIDAGETIALGLVIRNRWGMSENTLVTIDTKSGISGLDDPYFTILNPTVNYGSVGTYSTQDAGKIFTDELFTGWEHPFIIEVSEDCPNDYRFTLNVTISCENALDAEDTNVYVNYGWVNENVRNGYILPQFIEEDMVLTKDNLYIIPNATIITAGVTVRVEPGTHIQFWSDDANDPYADSYIAYLVVNGNFLVEGTKEEPVYIYPSQLMDHYGVEIGSTSTGYVSLKYADITNFFQAYNNTQTGNHIDLAEHCTFRNNYGDWFYYRYVSNGNVHSSHTSSAIIGSINAKDCVFYKLGGRSGESLYGTFDRCIFTQCGINFRGNWHRNCVFLGNSLVDQTNPDRYTNSSMRVDGLSIPRYEEVEDYCYAVFYRPETGTTYIRWLYNDPDGVYAKLLNESLGGNFVKIETEDERNWLMNHWYYDTTNVGAYWDQDQNCYVWYDGTPVDLELFPSLAEIPEGRKNVCLDYQSGDGEESELKFVSRDAYISIYEISGPILPTNITFADYDVSIDLDTTYQIQLASDPVQLPLTQFIFESSDETVITVSDTGLVTPVGLGTADVWVWSLDRAVKNRVTFHIKDYVALEGIRFPYASVKLEVGKSLNAKCVLTPADTTRRNVVYTSSDPSIVSVENGILVAHKKGTVTITATCEGITATMQVTAFVKATRFSVQNTTVTMESGDTSLPIIADFYPADADLDLQWTPRAKGIVEFVDGKMIPVGIGDTSVDVVDRNSGRQYAFHVSVTAVAPSINAAVITAQVGSEPLALPEVTFAAGAKFTPVWEILDPAVAELTDDGKIQLNGAGITTLRFTDTRNGLRDEISIYVTEGETPRIQEILYQGGDIYMAWLEDGSVYRWNEYNVHEDPQLLFKNVLAISATDSRSLFLLPDYTLWSMYGGEDPVQITSIVIPEEVGNIVDIAGTYYDYYSETYGCMHLLNDAGEVYAVGGDGSGVQGIGNNERLTELTKLDTFSEVDPVVQVESYRGEVTYYLTKSGCLYISGGVQTWVTPIMIARNVTWLNENGCYYVADGKLMYFGSQSYVPETIEGDFGGYQFVAMNVNSHDSGNRGIATKDGKVYGIGNGRVYYEKFMTNLTSAIDGVAGYSYDSRCYVVTEEGLLFGTGTSERYTSNGYVPDNGFLGMTTKTFIPFKDELFLPIVKAEEKLTLLESNLTGDILNGSALELTFNKQLLDSAVTIYESGVAMMVYQTAEDEKLTLVPAVGFVEGTTYTVVVSSEGTRGYSNVTLASDLVIEFVYVAPEIEDVPETDVEPDTDTDVVIPDVMPDVEEEEQVVYTAIVDETIQRYHTAKSLIDDLTAYIEKTQYNPNFSNNAILNPISTDFEVSHWLRLQAPSVTVGTHYQIPIGRNYWGSVNDRAIGLQIIDYGDFPNYARLMYAPFLTEAPENTFPFVTSVKLYNKYGEEVSTVGNEEVTFRVTFNRDMDTSIPLLVRFGSAYPYGDYEVPGKYVDARTWEGVYTLNTLIENGNQYFTISNGCSATDDLELQLDQFRFGFVIDTTAAQALIMQGTAMDTGIELKWTQDDFDTLMGYNVYRSTSEDGFYQRLNSTVISADTMTWFDETVEPGVVYYYNFTVVRSDMSESEPSGKIVIMSKDTMAPNIYHSPISGAFTGANLVLSATVSDNLNIAFANLYYRIVGTDTWKIVRMNNLNDKYSAIIPAADVTTAGIEYYFEAFDGVSYTYQGNENMPFVVAVQEAIDENSLGDVDGNGVIDNLDAVLVLYAINDKYNMTAEQFARADLNGDGQLQAAEALRILQYASGIIGSVKM